MPQINHTKSNKANYKKAFAIFLLGQIATTNVLAIQAIGGPAAYVVDGGTTNANVTVGTQFDQINGTLSVGFENNAGIISNAAALAPPTAAAGSTNNTSVATINVLNGSKIITVDSTTVIAFDGSGASVIPGAGCLLTINNSGIIANQNPVGTNNPLGNAIVGDAPGNTSLQITNNSGATIVGLINISNAAIANKIINAGTITGAITLGTQPDTLTNSGTITGAISGAAGGYIITNNTNASITGNITGGAVANKITNSGTVTGNIIGGAGGDTIINNSGATITGSIASNAIAGAINNITNSGTITANITAGLGGDTITNNGTVTNIIGNAASAAANTITNSGTVTGNITAGGGGDNITNSGTVTGNITGGAGGDTITLNGGTVAGIIDGTVGGANILNIDGSFSTQAVIKNIQTINTNAGTFNVTQAITNVDTSFNNASITTISPGGNITGAAGPIINTGTLNIQAGGTIGAGVAMGPLTNNANASINVQASVANALHTGAVNNSGSISITSTAGGPAAVVTLAGIANNLGGNISITNNNATAGAIVLGGVPAANAGTISITNNTGAANSINIGAFAANAGTFNITGPIAPIAGVFNNQAGATVNFNAGTIATNFNIGGAGNTFTNNGTVVVNTPSTITGDYTNSGTHLLTINNDIPAILTATKINFGTNNNTLQIKTTGNTILQDGQAITIANVIPGNPPTPIGPGKITVTNDLSATVSYSYPVVNGQNIQTTAIRTPLNNIVSGNNQTAIANVINKLINNNASIQGDFRLALATIDQLPTPTEVNQAMKELLPNLEPANAILAGFTANNLAIGAVEGRISNIARTEINSINPQPTGYAAGNMISNRNLWIKGFNAVNHQKEIEDYNAYKSNTFGVIFGVDNQITEHFWFGLALSYAYTNIKTNDKIADVTALSSHQATIYSSYSPEKYYIDYLLAITKNTYHSERNINFGTLHRVATGKFYGLQPSIKISGGYINQYNHILQIIPNTSLQYTHVSQKQYSESDANSVSLKNISSKSLQQLEAGIGVKFAMLYNDKNSTTSHDIHFMTLYDIINSKQKVTAMLSGGGDSFTINGNKNSKTTLNVGVGLTYMLKDRLHCTVNYDLRLKKQFVGHFGSLTARYFI